MKIAVVLLNLGGPLKKDDIYPYLKNFFMDKNIIAAPWIVRRILAELIAKSRAKGAALESYGRLDFCSPLLKNTQAQAQALEDVLKETPEAEYRVFTAMRYWHPFAEETAQEVKAYDPQSIVLLPLYPQFSTATVKSALENWDAAAKALGLIPALRRACCWFSNPGFVSASADLIHKTLEKAPTGTRLLFSAHGLPEKTVRAGDPYQWQCERTADAIVEKLGIAGLDWQMCYQSRVGPLKWIGPSTDEALEKAALDGVGVVIYPLAFVSEHVETLVEIDIEYRAKAGALGIPYFDKVETVGTHPAFIAGLADIVRGGNAKAGGKMCPVLFKKCGCVKACG